MADISKIKLPDGVTYNVKDNSKLVKTTYEYNTEIAFGSTGKLLIGKFQCYDSNVTITIQSTTNITYYAVAVLATQNIDTAGGGTFTWNTYGDTNNTVTPNLYAKYASGSNWIEIYFSPNNWSKNLIHIQANALRSDPTNICESVSEIPSSATRKPTNTFGTSPKFTDTTYALSTSGNNVVLTPSSGSANTITVPYATNAGTVNNLTVQTAVPANAVFTDAKVTQTAVSNTDTEFYSILLSNTSDSTSTETAGVKKTRYGKMCYNPNDNKIVNVSGINITNNSNNSNRIALDTWMDGGFISVFDTNFSQTIALKGANGSISATSLNGVTIGSSPKFTDTHRTVKIDSSEVLGDNTTPLNLISGTGIRLAQWAGSGGSGIVIDATGPSVTDISTQYTFHKTSGPWTVQDIRAVRSGNVVTMQLVIKGGSAVSAGSNGIAGTLSGGPLPAKVNGGTQDIITSGVCYYGVSALVGTLTSSGSFILRLLINNQSLGSSTTSMCFTFVCD